MSELLPEAVNRRLQAKLAQPAERLERGFVPAAAAVGSHTRVALGRRGWT